MKRFVTYLYEYERGNKSKNIGFIRVNVRGNETTMEVYIRNYLRGTSNGKLFVIVLGEKLIGIELGKIEIKNGQSDTSLVFETENIKGSGFSLTDIVGMGICMDGDAYIASCWKDEYVSEISRGEFDMWKDDEIEEPIEEEYKVEVRVAERTYREHTTTYEKIDLSQIRDLPSPNWHLTTNSFLVHGFWNYGYLVLKKELEEDKETISLGVPGIFETPEAVMAVLFGFPTFEETPQEMATMEMNQPRKILDKNTNQEAKAGTFGSWFVELKD